MNSLKYQETNTALRGFVSLDVEPYQVPKARHNLTYFVKLV